MNFAKLFREYKNVTRDFFVSMLIQNTENHDNSK